MVLAADLNSRWGILRMADFLQLKEVSRTKEEVEQLVQRKKLNKKLVGCISYGLLHSSSYYKDCHVIPRNETLKTE